MNKRTYVLAAVFSLLAAFSVFAQNNRNSATPPSWAIGTWYGTTSYGPRIIITIARNGTVTSQIENNTAYGVYQRGDMAVFDTVSVRVSRSGNGIETYNAASGERVIYSRRGFDDVGGNVQIYGGGNNVQIYGTTGGHDADGLGQPGVIVYEDRDGRGRSQSFGYGRYLSAGNTLGNLRNDKASSVVVSGGYHVRLCESEGDGAGDGQCEDYGAGTYNLRLNDKASFIEVTRTGIWGGNGNGYPNGYPNNYPNGNPNNYPAPGYPSGSGAVYINDLAGQKTSTADSQMRQRGFQQVDSYRDGGTDFRIWWRAYSRQCIQVALEHNRYSTITDIGSHQGCQ
jgi:hypothetical protein